MIYIGYGGNLTSERFESPEKAIDFALLALETRGLSVVRKSSLYASAPVPVSDQPWYINGVAQIESADDTSPEPAEILAKLHEVEDEAGRVRSVRNAARILDIDLLAAGDQVIGAGRDTTDGLVLPHPRLQDRAFVLHPLAEIAPDWAHPVSGAHIRDLIVRLDPGQQIRRL